MMRRQLGRQPPGGARRTRVILLALAVALLLSAYAGTLKGLLRIWSTYEASYGPVILGVSALMVWTRRDTLRGLPHVRALLPGTVVALFGSAALVAGVWGSIALLQDLSLVITLHAAVLLLLGGRMWQALFWPVSYLVLTVPFMDRMLGGGTVFIQDLSASIASHALSLLGIPVLRQGKVLQLPHITLEVARVCSGVNHIVALAAFSVPLGFFTLSSNVARLTLAVLALFLGIVVNGIRIAAIGVWSRYSGDTDLHGPLGILLASFIFFSGVAVLLVATSLLAWQGRGGRDRATPAAPAGTGLAAWERSGVSGAAVLAATSLALCAFLFLYPSTRETASPDLSRLPLSVGDWVGTEVGGLGAGIDDLHADVEIKRVYRRGPDEEIAVYVGCSPTPASGQGVLDPRFESLHRDAVQVRVATGGSSSLAANLNFSRKFGKPSRIYSWYSVRGEPVDRRLRMQLAVALNTLLRWPSRGAVVMIMRRQEKGEGLVPEPGELAFLGEFAPLVQDALRD